MSYGHMFIFFRKLCKDVMLKLGGIYTSFSLKINFRECNFNGKKCFYENVDQC